MFAAYTAALILLAWYFRNALNTDAVAYLRIASYVSHGQWHLAVSGYWGPLASWIIALFLKAGIPPLIAARLFMILSALFFTWACAQFFKSIHLSEKWISAGTILSSLAALYWSVQFITPDLFLAALVALAASRMSFFTNQPKNRLRAFTLGLLWGFAYLTKAVALPLAVLTSAVIGLIALWKKETERNSLLQHALITAAGCLVVALPWITTLSLKYGQPTFSTTPSISHTLTGPPDRERYHPFATTFHTPEPGRITSWEEPSRMPYNHWSPWENSNYAAHQARVIFRNLRTCLTLLTSLNIAWFVLLFAIPIGWKTRADQKVIRTTAKLLLIPGLLVVLYVPCYVTLTEQRFFFAAYPFLFGALAIWAQTARDSQSNGQRFKSKQARNIIVIVGALIPLLASVVIIRDLPKRAGDCAADLASRMHQAHLEGSIAGSGSLPGGRTGLYVAYLLDQPWCGDERMPDPEGLKASGAQFAILNRNSAWVKAVEEDGTFTSLDGILFSTEAEAEQFPVKVFQIRKSRAN